MRSRDCAAVSKLRDMHARHECQYPPGDPDRWVLTLVALGHSRLIGEESRKRAGGKSRSGRYYLCNPRRANRGWKQTRDVHRSISRQKRPTDGPTDYERELILDKHLPTKDAQPSKAGRFFVSGPLAVLLLWLSFFFCGRADSVR